ncbi:MAG: PHP domain-containing protein [Candidatus Marinimicrobia bacterium]|nr:PHP domain-containing protein [Candidatus Neomarinimicrobiota bacterium]
MLRCFQADLHIHTCLSPCGDLLMSPKRVVEEAARKKLDIIAISDHNSAENVAAAVRVGQDNDVTVIPAMEVTTVEEAHFIAFFDRPDPVLDLQNLIYENLPGKNDPTVFGEQIVVNELDEVEGYNDRLLIGACGLSINKLIEEIHKRGGLIVAAHVDRQAFSIISQLGFIPPDIELDGLEISARIPPGKAVELFPEFKKYPLITSSDAHYLQDIGKVRTSFMLQEPTFGELRQAFANTNSRRLFVEEV